VCKFLNAAYEILSNHFVQVHMRTCRPSNEAKRNTNSFKIQCFSSMDDSILSCALGAKRGDYQSSFMSENRVVFANKGVKGVATCFKPVGIATPLTTESKDLR